jgi:Kdo2-lipid IVA lauroyltransferase/acyltransferase
MAKPPKSHLHPALHTPIYLAIRVAAAAVQIAGTRASVRAAKPVVRAVAGSPMLRKRLARAVANLRVAYPSWSDERLRELAVRSYEHLVTLGVETFCAPRQLTEEGWHNHISLGDIDPAVRSLIGGRPCMLITGHSGNWEMLGYGLALLGFPIHALYRPLDMAPLDRWLRETRELRGMTLVDKFGALRQLPALMQGGAPLAFVADQNGGDRGIFVPFFNRLTSTYKAIGLLALQHDADIICGFTRRLGPEETVAHGLARGRRLPAGGPDDLRFQLELTDLIRPEDWKAHPDPLFYLTARYRRSIEQMVRMAPEQYLWMHRVWRSRPRHERLGRPFPPALREKLATLPWMTSDDIEAVVEHSARDARTLAETGSDRLS